MPLALANSIPPNFNPRTRAGCDIGIRHGRPLPAAISIHAPVLGATTATEAFLTFEQLFQSTHPCWVRRDLQDKTRTWRAEISIHAPVLGATRRNGIRQDTD